MLASKSPEVEATRCEKLLAGLCQPDYKYRTCRTGVAGLTLTKEELVMGYMLPNVSFFDHRLFRHS